MKNESTLLNPLFEAIKEYAESLRKINPNHELLKFTKAFLNEEDWTISLIEEYFKTNKEIEGAPGILYLENYKDRLRKACEENSDLKQDSH